MNSCRIWEADTCDRLGSYLGDTYGRRALLWDRKQVCLRGGALQRRNHSLRGFALRDFTHQEVSSHSLCATGLLSCVGVVKLMCCLKRMADRVLQNCTRVQHFWDPSALVLWFRDLDHCDGGTGSPVLPRHSIAPSGCYVGSAISCPLSLGLYFFPLHLQWYLHRFSAR